MIEVIIGLFVAGVVSVAIIALAVLLGKIAGYFSRYKDIK